MEKITSLQNPKIKNIIHLTKTKERRDQQLIIIEGYRELNMAIEFGLNMIELFYCNEINSNIEFSKIVNKFKNSYEISRNIFEKIAYRENSDGIIALATPRYLSLSDLKLSSNPLILVIESVEKPGNLGALLRTADAAALDAVIVCNPHTDIFNPNVIRSSLGCVFSQQIVTCTSLQAITFFKENNIKSFAVALTAKSSYLDSNFSEGTAIVMGSESDGLSKEWIQNADNNILIPMNGRIDSLNVSVSAAIIVFEAIRQRKLMSKNFL